MEVKCKVCGTINDGETNFCKGCFVKLDVENPENVTYNPKEKEISAEIEEKEEVIPWSDSVDNEILQENNYESPIFNSNNELKKEKTLSESMSQTENNTFKPIGSEQENNQSLELNNESLPQIQSEEEEFKPINDLLSNENNLEKTEIIDFDLIKDAYNNLQNNSVEDIKIETPFEPIETEENSKLHNNENGTLLEQPIEDISAEPLSTQEKIELPKVELVVPNDNQIEYANNNEEASIPEISNSWNENSLTDLDMEQFNIENDSWEDEKEEKTDINYLSSGKLFLKFLLNCLLFGILFGALCIGFRYLLNNIFNLGNNAELIFIVISSISSIAALLIATDKTFKKQVPLASKINETTFSILLFVALPYLLIKLAYNLYVGTTFVIFLILIALSLIILAIFFNYMRNLIRMKHQMKKEDKASFIYGIFSILLIGLTLYGVYTYKDKDYNISFDIIFNDGENIKLVESYINEVEKSISRNKTEIEGYEIPNIIDDVEYAAFDGNKPDGMALYLDENGNVSSGTILIKNRVYSYDGVKVRAS